MTHHINGRLSPLNRSLELADDDKVEPPTVSALAPPRKNTAKRIERNLIGEVMTASHAWITSLSNGVSASDCC